MKIYEIVRDRPVVGNREVSRVFRLDATEYDLGRVLDEPTTNQFSRATAVSAKLNPGIVTFRSDSRLLTYKSMLGWTTESTLPEQEDGNNDLVDPKYWENARRLARQIGSILAPSLSDPAFHQADNNLGVSVLIEHTRRKKDGNTPHESQFVPFFSGTSAIDMNIAPDKFGPHIDLGHGAPFFIAFAAQGGGTVIFDGEMIYPGRICDQTQWAAAASGDDLRTWQIPDRRLYCGDGRRLLHTAPESPSEGLRDLVRVFIGPSEPNRYLDK